MSLLTATPYVNYHTFNVPSLNHTVHGMSGQSQQKLPVETANYVEAKTMYTLRFVPAPLPNPLQNQPSISFLYPLNATASITPPAPMPLPVLPHSHSHSPFHSHSQSSSLSPARCTAIGAPKNERVSMCAEMPRSTRCSPLPPSPCSLDSGSSASASPRDFPSASMVSPACIYSKSAEQFQRRKLSVVLFDWDDTLYPTTRIISNKENVSLDQLQEFGKALYDLLQQYVKVYGDSNIYIVTNSSKNWTFESLNICSKIYQKKASNEMHSEQQRDCVDYFGAIHGSLMSKIRVISAQFLYGQRYPQKPSVWKIKAFKQITIEHFKNIKGMASGDNLIYEIVSIGDSENEFVASFEAKYKLNKFIKRRKSKNNIIRLHRVKLKKEPTIQEMVKQMRFLIEEASVMYSEPGSITVRYE